jgi:hypothetical protein
MKKSKLKSKKVFIEKDKEFKFPGKDDEVFLMLGFVRILFGI